MDIKTVVIINDFNFIQGGASKIAIETARLLKEENIKVYFFSAVNKKEEEIAGIEYISTNQQEALKTKNKLKGLVNGIYNFRAKKELEGLLTKLDKETTIVHVHGWTKALSSSIFDIAFKMKFKVILTLHDYFTACPNGGYFNFRQNKICKLRPLSLKCLKCNCDSRNYVFKLYRVIRQFVQNKIVKLNEKIENVITISELSEKILKPTLGSKANIVRIYNPIDTDNDDKKVDIENNEYYLYVGRVSKEKGVDLFCKAITDLNFKGIIVGDGSDKERLQKEYPNLEFTGWKNSDEVKVYMKKAKALIFPSLWYETAGLTILEAAAFDIHCLVSKWCAGREFVNEECLFENEEELKEKIKKIENKELNFYKKNQDMSAKTYITKLLNLFSM